ncbi:MAG TPA: hypothetical protein DCP85_09045, partial [Elusimicrobia bacterium]|nr:hypothetical protein [Elusimicrobiota bacterium]
RLDVSLNSAFSSLVTGYNNKDLGNATSASITGLSAGTAYYARLRAYDAAGNVSANSAAVSAATLAAPDTTAPTASITAPTAGAAVSGAVSVSAAAADSVGVTKVEFYVDGNLKATDTSSPYSHSLDTTQLANGSHALLAKAYDAAGNVGQSASVSVTVSNSVPPPPGAPTISGVSGNIINGSNITISGSGFGTKNPAAPLVWNNHEACAVGSDIVAACGYNNEGGDGSKAYIRNDKAYGLQGSKSAKMDYATGENSMFPRIGTNISGGATEVYVSFQAYWTHYAGSGGSSFIFKWSRGGSNPSYSGIPRFYETIRPNSSGFVYGGDAGYVTNTGTTYNAATYMEGQNADRWNRTEYHYKLSSPAGTANGAFEQWVNSKKNINLVNAITRTVDQSSSKIDYVMTPFDGNDSYGTSNGYYFWIDDYYIDTTPARVEICSGSTWANRGDCEIQIPSAWSATAVTVAVNQGAIPNSANRYLYVIDAGGNASAGRQITFGSGPSGDTAPPSAPTNLALGSPTSSSFDLSWIASTDNAAVAGYRLDVSQNSAFSSLVTGYDNKDLGNATSTSITGLSAGTAYYARLRAYDAAGNVSANSAWAWGATGAAAAIGAACNAPALPLTGTRIINVSNETQLQTAINNLQAGDTIVLANGAYNLTRTLFINGKNNVTVRGASGCDNVVLAGKGMDNANYGSVEFGIWSNSLNTTIAHLTIRDTYDNEIMFNSGAQSPRIYSVKLLNAGSQFVKANPTDGPNGIGVDNGIIEYCWMEYTNGTPADHGAGPGYTNGLSAHASDNWIIRGNVFKNFHTPDSATYLWNPAVLMWNHSSNTTTENNIFINVDRAVAYGLQDVTGSDHSGGVIRNNFVYLAPNLLSATRKASSDGMIIAWDSPSTIIAHNTILANGNANKSIEFRFAAAGSEARNNLADAPIGGRDGASFAQSGNYLSAAASMFADPDSGNLHLLDISSTRTNVIDKVAALASVPADFDGNPRPSGANADIGADEFVSGNDTTAPSAPGNVTLNSPTASSLNLAWSASTDNMAVAGYRLDVSLNPAFSSFVTGYQSKNLGSVTNTSITGLSAGTAYYARLRAYDAAGNTSANSAAAFARTSALPDILAPTAAIISPANGANVSGTVDVAAAASDNTGVVKLEFYIDGLLKSTLTSAPYAYSLDASVLALGSHAIMVKAYDAAGNSGAQSITVNVIKSSGKTPPGQAKARKSFLSPSSATGIIFGTEATKVEIFNMRGKKVFEAAGTNGAPITWTGKESGKMVESGAYMARITDSSGAKQHQTIVVVK